MGDRDQDGFIGSGHGGNTAGTGGPEHGSAGEGGADVPTGAGQGDDLADALGGREGGGADTPSANESGDLSGGSSEVAASDVPAAAGGGAPDAGSPGGMGGVRGGMSNPDHRPNGGVSPIQNDVAEDRG